MGYSSVRYALQRPGRQSRKVAISPETMLSARGFALPQDLETQHDWAMLAARCVALDSRRAALPGTGRM
ncbi:MAG: hypothetical protein JWQ73_2282 [Variovorax sp.]|nr:hypothetical protein [Variovorax sp.]